MHRRLTSLMVLGTAEYRARRIKQEERALGLPLDDKAREEEYAIRRLQWQPLRNALDTHRWSFQKTECQECGMNLLCLVGNEKAACLVQCLATAVPRWPTGHVLPWIHDLVDHTKHCTSHSSSLTENSFEFLAKMHISSKTLHEEMWESNSTSSKPVKAPTPKKSLPNTRSLPSASSRPKLQGFSIPRKSS